jgi:hypothetical protein
MMKAKSMPPEFWGEAVTTAVFILNRSPTKALKGVTPYEAWHGRKPNVSYLKTFGCIGHVKKVKPGQAKLDDRSVKAVFLGYESGTKAYRLYDPVRGKVLVSRDCRLRRSCSLEMGGGRGRRRTRRRRDPGLLHRGAPGDPCPRRDSKAAGDRGSVRRGGKR